MNYPTTWSLLRRTFDKWSEHEEPRLGAALAFYTVLSLAPLVVLLTAFVAFIVGHDAVRNELLTQIQSMIGQQGASAVKVMMENPQKPSTGIFASVMGVLTLLFGASGVFGELESEWYWR
jgi:membrane protein